ncbi:MAG: hypothetical protein K9K86_09885 [Pseudomonadales bacterium]|nr:hypothetical protein [Pseudomonadales bacterium]
MKPIKRIIGFFTAKREIKKVMQWIYENDPVIGYHYFRENTTASEYIIGILDEMADEIQAWEGAKDSSLRAKFFNLGQRISPWFPRTNMDDYSRVDAMVSHYIEMLNGETVTNSVVAKFLREMERRFPAPKGHAHYIADSERGLAVFVVVDSGQAYPVIPKTDHDWRHPSEVADRLEQMISQRAR